MRGAVEAAGAVDVLDNRTQSTNRCKRRQRRRQQRPHLGRGQESPQELREAGRVGAAANDPLDAPGHGAEVPRGQLHQRRRGPSSSTYATSKPAISRHVVRPRATSARAFCVEINCVG